MTRSSLKRMNRNARRLAEEMITSVHQAKLPHSSIDHVGAQVFARAKAFDVPSDVNWSLVAEKLNARHSDYSAVLQW